MKPYYNPSTKETYLKWDLGDGKIVRAITGSTEVCDWDSEGYTLVEKNEFGEIVRKTHCEPLLLWS